MPAEFQIYQSGAEYRWRLKTDTHEIAAVGVGYPTRDEAIRGAEAVKESVRDAAVIDQTDEG
jgi:uncharacterized protein YegP (UPF0339 family)